MTKRLTVQNLHAQLSEEANNSVFSSKALLCLNTSMWVDWDDKHELSDWVSEQLDYDDFDIDHDVFVDTLFDIILVVTEFYGLE